MQLYKPTMINGKRDRPARTLNITLDERPERPVPKIRTAKDRVKLIKHIESVVRRSMEYKDYVKFLKDHMDMKRCAVLRNLKIEPGKKYSIEIHHEPFTLFEIVDAVLTKFDETGEPINVLRIADEVLGLHYAEKVGLIPLSVTMHELVHKDEIFIPLQLIYHKYDKFYAEYEDYIANPATKEKIEMKAQLSLKCGDILSSVLDPEFTYINIEGFQFPKIPEEWKNVMAIDAAEDCLNNA